MYSTLLQSRLFPILLFIVLGLFFVFGLDQGDISVKVVTWSIGLNLREFHVDTALLA